MITNIKMILLVFLIGGIVAGYLLGIDRSTCPNVLTSSTMAASATEKKEGVIFTELSQVELPNTGITRGNYCACVAGDFDGDGDLDVFAMTERGTAVFIENQIPLKGKVIDFGF